MTTRRQVLVTGSAALGVSLMPSLTRAQAATATLAFGPATAVYSLGMIADAKGYFKAENLDFKLILGNAGTHGRQALAAEQALFAHGDASHPLQLSKRGKKCKIVMATQMIASISNIVVRRDLYDAGITTVEKLAAYKRPDGAKPIIAATAIGSGTWMYGRWSRKMETSAMPRKKSSRRSRSTRSYDSVELPRTQRRAFARPPVPAFVAAGLQPGSSRAHHTVDHAGILQSLRSAHVL